VTVQFGRIARLFTTPFPRPRRFARRGGRSRDGRYVIRQRRTSAGLDAAGRGRFLAGLSLQAAVGTGIVAVLAVKTVRAVHSRPRRSAYVAVTVVVTLPLPPAPALTRDATRAPACGWPVPGVMPDALRRTGHD
jgi:hypothetical protein